MSGHSKWAQIKRKKGALDKKRGALFSRLVKEITVAAREGGGNPDANIRLRAAIDRAKAASMPADNIERAIKRGTGQLPGVSYEEITYEGYAPGGVAVIVESLTDSRNRTTAAVRHIFSKRGGNLGENGCVSWLFDRRGVIRIAEGKYPEEFLLEKVMEAGGEDLVIEDGEVRVLTSPEDLHKVCAGLEEAGIAVTESELTLVPKNLVRPSLEEAKAAMTLLEALEEDEDVQAVHSNLDPPEELLSELE
ncbi:MAG: YebC/PmpR family DNA-binding transcriptional regulator [Candidatus Hydrogenedentota bacterium]|nr:MAG: YebC/PmpR family DNA-binding transcriptional regulator [Candidatus Hydrogenedentota bacterium]